MTDNSPVVMFNALYTANSRRNDIYLLDRVKPEILDLANTVLVVATTALV